MREPAKYFPLEKGIYEVVPGLRTFGTDFGNGDLDQKIFQIDADFLRYRASKEACRAENISKYFCTSNLDPKIEFEVAQFMAIRLQTEYPEIFELVSPRILKCKHTHEVIEWNDQGELLSGKYSSLFDALAMQVQEDMAITCQGSDGKDWLALLHLCSPSHWAAEDKIGKSFFQVHAPVPGIEKINQAAKGFVDAIVNKGPYVRFVWGFGSDNRLNHHPVPPAHVDPIEWKGRSFDEGMKSGTPFYLRVERQVIYGFPKFRASLFCIRVSHWDGREIKKDLVKIEKLVNALNSMNAKSLVYKGLLESRESIIEWLKN